MNCSHSSGLIVPYLAKLWFGANKWTRMFAVWWLIGDKVGKLLSSVEASVAYIYKS